MRRRKLMLPPFHGERMRGYEQVIAEVTERTVADWPRETEFALHPSMQAITLEVILRAVFGVEDAERARGAAATSWSRSSAPAPHRRRSGFAVPGVRRLPPFRSIPAMIERADELLYAEIAERRGRPELAERDDILSMLLAARFEDGTAMEDSELRDQLMTLLLAGHETTATGLAWTFDLLLHHPAALDRLEAELAAGEHEYLDAVIEESLRVRPVVPFTGRLLRETAELGGYELPAGTTCSPGIYLAHTARRRLPGAVRVPPRAVPRRGPRRPTPGSRSAAAPGAASAPPSPRSRCAVAIETILASVSSCGPPRRGPRSRCAATSPSRPRTARG